MVRCICVPQSPIGIPEHFSRHKMREPPFFCLTSLEYVCFAFFISCTFSLLLCTLSPSLLICTTFLVCVGETTLKLYLNKLHALNKPDSEGLLSRKKLFKNILVPANIQVKRLGVKTLVSVHCTYLKLKWQHVMRKLILYRFYNGNFIYYKLPYVIIIICPENVHI